MVNGIASRGPDGIAVARATAADAASVRRILPQAFTASTAPDVLIVARDPAGAMIGAAAVAWQAWGTPQGFPVLVGVIDRARRRGLGRRLLRAAAAACQGETERLHAWHAVAEGSAEEAFLHATGFTVNRRVLHFEADGQRFYDMIARIHRRMGETGHIPKDAQVVSVADAPPAQVARLIEATFGTRYDIALANARGAARAASDKALSVALLVDKTVAGALLFRWRDGLPEIDVNVVASRFRGGWANVALLERATANGLAAGARRFRFYCEDTVRDTINLARRVNAAQTAVTLEFVAEVEKLQPTA